MLISGTVNVASLYFTTVHTTCDNLLAERTMRARQAESVPLNLPRFPSRSAPLLHMVPCGPPRPCDDLSLTLSTMVLSEVAQQRICAAAPLLTFTSILSFVESSYLRRDDGQLYE